MAKCCELTGKGPQYGNKVSHSNIKTRTRWTPNMKKKKYFIPELSRSITFNFSADALSTIDKYGGITQAIIGCNEKHFSDRLIKLRSEIKKAMAKPKKKASAQALAA